jgi:hypothetical protein
MTSTPRCASVHVSTLASQTSRPSTSALPPRRLPKTSTTGPLLPPRTKHHAVSPEPFRSPPSAHGPQPGLERTGHYARQREPAAQRRAGHLGVAPPPGHGRQAAASLRTTLDDRPLLSVRSCPPVRRIDRNCYEKRRPSEAFPSAIGNSERAHCRPLSCPVSARLCKSTASRSH